MDSVSKSALENLTATYTDSEGEDEEDDVDSREARESSDSETDNSVYQPPSSRNTPADTPTKATPLVSYTINESALAEGDDDEIEGPQPMDISDEENPSSTRSQSPVTSQNRDSHSILPPEPEGHCSKALQDHIAKMLERKEKEGLDLNKEIQRRKMFRNPSIYEKLIDYCKIDEFGTNYPVEIYDPHRWGPESYYDELAKAQKAEMEKRMKENKEKMKVEFISGTKKPQSSGGSEPDKRKSKWDQQALNSAASTQPVGPIKPTGVINLPAPTSITRPPFHKNPIGSLGSTFGSLTKMKDPAK